MPAGANDALDQTRRLQIKLYLAAKRSPTRRFHALYDKVYRTDVLVLQRDLTHEVSSRRTVRRRWEQYAA